MDITKDLIESLTPKDIEKIIKYKELLEEAKTAVELVKEVYMFHLGENKITLWSDSCNAEYLTHDGIWQARYLHQEYDILVTVDSIFEIYKAEYEYKSNVTSKRNNMIDSAEYFRSFIKRTKLENSTIKERC